MIDEKKIELIKKLQRLAERGVGGEKEGAQKKLQQLMKKYDIEESDLSDDKLEDHEWKYHNDFELRLLKQTIYKVMGKDGLNQMYHYRSGQDFSIAGHQRGADEGSETRSSLMWETIHIIEQMGEWKPQYIIWENVKNVKSKHMIANFVRYQKELEQMGYTNNYEVLDAREFGLPQARERVFTISCLKGEKFNFDDLIRTPMQDIRDFLEDNDSVPEVYDVTQPSVRNVIGQTGIKRATVIKDYAFTITTRQDRTPAQVIDCGGGRFRYLTELECWRLQGYTDEDFERAKAVHKRAGRYYTALYKQAGNSIAVPIFESIFRKIILNETA